MKPVWHVRPSTKSLFVGRTIQLKFVVYVEVNECYMMVCHVTGSKVKVMRPSKLQSYLLCHLQWQLANDSWLLKLRTMSKFCRARFLIIGPVLCHATLNFTDVVPNVAKPETRAEELTAVTYRTNLFWFIAWRLLHPVDLCRQPLCFTLAVDELSSGH